MEVSHSGLRLGLRHTHALQADEGFSDDVYQLHAVRVFCSAVYCHNVPYTVLGGRHIGSNLCSYKRPCFGTHPWPLLKSAACCTPSKCLTWHLLRIWHCTAGDLTYTLGRPLNRLAKLFVDEQLLDRLKAFAEQQPQLLSPTFLDEANEARMINTDWLRFQGADACAWLASAAARQSSGGR